MRVLDGVNTWSLIRPGHESSPRSAQFIRRWGLLRNLPLGQSIGDEEVLMGSLFGWVVDGFFLDGSGMEVRDDHMNEIEKTRS